jgi:hypothetical protein
MLTFQPGVTSQVITITVNPATIGELTESFNVDLSNVSNATMNKSRGIVTITPPTSWVTTMASEFTATGSTVGTGAYVSETSGGEISLAPTVGTEFSGTALPTGWTSSVQSGGFATVGNGSVTVDGATVLAPTTYSAGHTLEFVATFSGAADQNVGFGLTSALLPPFAMFGVKSDGQLYARSVGPGQVFETPMAGSWFNAPHRFRIDWNASTVVYWIDGTQRASHAITYKGATGTMRPAITDATVGGGGALSVDWMRMTAYASSGTYTSPVYNAGAPVAWQNLTWTADSTTGNTITVKVRTGSTADLTSATWTTITSQSQMINSTMQYAQYQVTLSTTVTNSTPAVKEVVLTFLR